jgi:hypothetical protein
MRGCNCPRCRGGNVKWIIPILILAGGWAVAQLGKTFLPATLDNLAIGSGLVVIGFIWTVVVSAKQGKWWVIGIALMIFGMIFPSVVSYLIKANLYIGKTIFPSGEAVILGFLATGIIIIGVLFLAAYGLRAFLRFLNS